MQPDEIFQAVVFNDDTGLIVGVGRDATIPDAIRNAMLSRQADRDGCGEFSIEVYAVKFGEPLGYANLDREVLGVFSDAA